MSKPGFHIIVPDGPDRFSRLRNGDSFDSSPKNVLMIETIDTLRAIRTIGDISLTFSEFWRGSVVVREREMHGKDPSSTLGGGFLFYSRNTSNNSEEFK